MAEGFESRNKTQVNPAEKHPWDFLPTQGIIPVAELRIISELDQNILQNIVLHILLFKSISREIIQALSYLDISGMFERN